jgi:hypothetical protein
MNRNRNLHSVLTKNQFLQANYKFIISPCINNFDEGLYNPDCLISWELGIYFYFFIFLLFFFYLLLFFFSIYIFHVYFFFYFYFYFLTI